MKSKKEKLSVGAICTARDSNPFYCFVCLTMDLLLSWSTAFNASSHKLCFCILPQKCKCLI